MWLICSLHTLPILRFVLLVPIQCPMFLLSSVPLLLSISLSLAPPLVQYGFSYIISEALSVPTVLTLQQNYTWYRKGFQRWMIIWWQWMHLCDRHFNDITSSVIFSNSKIWGVKTFQQRKKCSPAPKLPWSSVSLWVKPLYFKPNHIRQAGSPGSTSF